MIKGALALVGAGEFLPQMDAVDRVLLQKAGGTRVVVLPTASAPDGPGVPEKWARMGEEHFARLGARVDALRALTREDCARADFVETVSAANPVYFSGGKPAYLYDTLVDTPLWDAVKNVLARGGILAGCSAGAMILGALVALIPGAPLFLIFLLVYDLNGVLLPILLVLMLRLANNKHLMGARANGRLANVLGWGTAIILIGLTVLLLASPVMGSK